MKINRKRIVSVLLILVLMVLSVSDFTGGGTVTAAEGSAVTIHFKSIWNGANIFYWNQNSGYNNPVKWPGESMASEGDGWYVHTFENTEKITFMFQQEGRQTRHFTKTTGEYWYVNDTWYDHQPEDKEITPTPTAKPTATSKPTKAPTATVAPTESLKPTRAVTPTSAPEVTIAATDKTIQVHFLSEDANVKMFYWNVNYGTNTPVAWPGVELVSEGNNWYGYTISNAQSANIVFVTGAGETEESFVIDGEWWYADGEVYDYNPKGGVTGVPGPIKTPTPSVKPTATSKPTPTPEPTVTEEATTTPTLEPTVTTEAESTPTPEPTITEEVTTTPTSEPTPTPKPEVKGKIIVHWYTTGSPANIYYWLVTGGDKEENVWPGEEMTSEGNNWYSYTLEGATSANIIFNNNGGNQTSDLENVKEGEYWYKEGKWVDDPSGPTPTPGPTSTPRPTNTPRPTRDPSKPTPTASIAQRGDDWDFRDETIYFIMTTRFMMEILAIMYLHGEIPQTIRRIRQRIRAGAVILRD